MTVSGYRNEAAIEELLTSIYYEAVRKNKANRFFDETFAWVMKWERKCPREFLISYLKWSVTFARIPLKIFNFKIRNFSKVIKKKKKNRRNIPKVKFFKKFKICYLIYILNINILYKFIYRTFLILETIWIKIVINYHYKTMGNYDMIMHRKISFSTDKIKHY